MSLVIRVTSIVLNYFSFVWCFIEVHVNFKLPTDIGCHKETISSSPFFFLITRNINNHVHLKLVVIRVIIRVKNDHINYGIGTLPLSLSFARLYQIDQTHRLQNLDTVALFAVVPVGLVRRSKQRNIHCTQVTISLFTIVSRGLLTCCQNTPLAVLGHTVLSDWLLLCSFFFFSFLLGWGRGGL